MFKKFAQNLTGLVKEIYDAGREASEKLMGTYGKPAEAAAAMSNERSMAALAAGHLLRSSGYCAVAFGIAIGVGCAVTGAASVGAGLLFAATTTLAFAPVAAYGQGLHDAAEDRTGFLAMSRALRREVAVALKDEIKVRFTPGARKAFTATATAQPEASKAETAPAAAPAQPKSPTP